MPPLGRHRICKVIDVKSLRCKGDDADKGFTDDGEIWRERRVFTNSGFNSFGGADDLMTCVYVAIFALGHEAGPATGDEGTGTGACHARGGIHTSGPVR